MVLSFLHWKERWLVETESTVTSSFEMLTVLLGRRDLRCTWSPRSLDGLASGWPWEGAHTWGCTHNNFAPPLSKDPHSEPLPGYLWGTFLKGCNAGGTCQNDPPGYCLGAQVVMAMLDCELPQARAVALASP